MPIQWTWLRVFMGILFVVIFTCCRHGEKDSTEIIPKTCRLGMMTESYWEEDVGAFPITFAYDQAGKLKVVKTFMHYEFKELYDSMVFTYNAADQLIKIQRSAIPTPDNPETLFFEYDTKGKIIHIDQLTYYQEGPIKTKGVDVEYDSQNRINLLTTSNTSIFSEFKYDVRGNVIRIEHGSAENDSNQVVVERYQTCTYDNKPNLYPESYQLYLLAHKAPYFCPNNPLEVLEYDGASDVFIYGITHSYKYSSHADTVHIKTNERSLTNANVMDYYIHLHSTCK